MNEAVTIFEESFSEEHRTLTGNKKVLVQKRYRNLDPELEKERYFIFVKKIMNKFAVLKKNFVFQMKKMFKTLF